MIQLTELLYSSRPTIDYAAVKERVQQILSSELDCSDPATASSAFLIFHKSHTIKYTEGEVPAQTAILRTDQPVRIEDYEAVLQQSWNCANAAELLLECRSACAVTEMMSRQLLPQDRAMIYHGVLQAMIELTNPHALVFKHSQQVIEPKSYLDASDKHVGLRPGSINVRLFNISNSDGDMVMDTRGLTDVGLHDLQCHFRELEPNSVAGVLFNTASYIFQHGPVIESGHTVAGVEQGSKWRCQFEDALLEPKREVLDLNPGEPYSAGNRAN
jgi:Domain of unknown function (DUF4261)